METNTSPPEPHRSREQHSRQKHSDQEPPVVLPPAFRTLSPNNRGRSGPRTVQSYLMEYEQRLDSFLGEESYGAPRVFDLFTMLAITLAFALMFALLQLLSPALASDAETSSIALGLFVTGVGLFQLALWGGKKPRMASLVAGPPLIMLIGIGLSLTSTTGLTSSAIVVIFFLSIFGVPAGYLGGAMVAGVFLIADAIRKTYLKTNQITPENDDDVFRE